LNFGARAEFLVIKLVKPTKTVCSWTPYQSGVDHLLFSKTKPYTRAPAAWILRKANATVRQEVRRLDAADRAFHQVAEFLALCVSDRRTQIQNLDETLVDKNHLGNLPNTGHPRIADELGIQGKQSRRFFRVSARRRFPLQQTTLAVEFPDSVDVGDKVVAASNLPDEFDLEISSRLGSR
jgi:hypothetical protein